MADPATAVPDGTATPAVPAPAAAPVAPAPHAALPGQDPDSPWLKPRLENAKATGAREGKAELLAELGVTDLAAAKAAIAEANAKIAANKTAEQKAAEYEAQLRALVPVAERNAAIISGWAEKEFSKLSPELQARVTKYAGDDPLRRLEAIELVASTPAPQPAAPPPIPAAGGTAQPNAAPPPPGGAPQPNHLATYTDLQRRDPFQAAHYLLNNFDAIQKAKQASA